MPSVREIVFAFYGAWRLALLDAGGIAYFGTTTDAFWRSFFAAAIIAPFFAVVMALRYSLDMGDVSLDMSDVDPARFVTIEAIAYVTGWVAFPYAMLSIARLIDRDEHYVRFIVAYNWTAVLQNALYMPIICLAMIGALPDGLSAILQFVALAVILFYTWFITRTALDIGGPAAVAIVLFDLILGIFINVYADKML
jgi:hypothetical protein